MRNAYNAFNIVTQFEEVVAEYTEAPDVIAVNSCTNAIFLCLEFFKWYYGFIHQELSTFVEIPKKTYVSIPMQIKHAGFKVRFRDEEWSGNYQLLPFSLFDSARRFTRGMYKNTKVYAPFICTSHHWSKTLGIQQGGCILFDGASYPEALNFFERARFDGRLPGVPPKSDNFSILGWHMYMSPEIAAQGLVRLMHLPDENKDLPNDDYPDLSLMEIFK